VDVRWASRFDRRIPAGVNRSRALSPERNPWHRPRNGNHRSREPQRSATIPAS
jgi:hypothetical protein